MTVVNQVCQRDNFLKHLPPHVAEQKSALLLTRLVGEIESLQGTVDKLTKWRPFATAPEDGNMILAWREDAGTFPVVYCSSECDPLEPKAADEEWCWFTMAGEDLTGDLPTLWLPFPEPPPDVQP